MLLNHNTTTMKTTIQFIYTFEESEQIALAFILDKKTLKDAQAMAEFAKMPLSDEEKAQLRKVSIRIYVHSGEEIKRPEWYQECNGKLYFNEKGELI